MQTSELCARLRVTPQKLNVWISQGLPCQGKGRARTFEPAAVRKWLIDNGKAVGADAPASVARTHADLARHFGVSTRTVANWLAMGCPGSAGGVFDLEAIARWRATVSETNSPEAERHRLERLRIAAEREQLGLDELRGRLVDVEIVQGLVERHIAEARAQIQQIPDLILTALPPDADKQGIRSQVAELIDHACAALATALDDMAEEIERGDEVDEV